MAALSENGFAWDLFGGGQAFHGVKMKPQQCRAILSHVCSAENEQDAHAIFYKMSPNGNLLTPVGEQYTAAFLLSRGKYSWIGFEWAGCRSTRYPRPASWDADYGVWQRLPSFHCLPGVSLPLLAVPQPSRRTSVAFIRCHWGTAQTH